MWGHHGPSVLIGIYGTMLALAVLPVTYPPGSRFLLSLSLIALLFVTYFEMRKHDRGLCERCAADFPLNPAQDAETYRRRLRLVHFLAEKRNATYFLVGILVTCLLPLFAPGPLYAPAKVLWVAALVVLMYYVQSGQTHRKLQPWCPDCGHQGGTDKVETPEPMPMGGLSR